MSYRLPCARDLVTDFVSRAILTLFQIQDAENDPLTRTAALSSLVSALMSLSFGIVYIVRFDNMRSMYRASRWAEVCRILSPIPRSIPTHLRG